MMSKGQFFYQTQCSSSWVISVHDFIRYVD